MLEDFERTTSTAYTRTEWVWLGDQPLAAITSSNVDGGTLLHAHADRMGVPRKLTTTSGTSVARLLLEPFGNGLVVEDTATDARMGRRYAGQYQDSAGSLIFNGYRALIPQLGVYTSPDPLHSQTIATSLGAGAYVYGNGRPFLLEDSDGRVTLTAALGIVLVVVAVGTGISVVSGLKGQADSDAKATVPGQGTFPGLNDDQDAFRHCIAACYYTHEYGSGAAETLGALNEALSPTSLYPRAPGGKDPKGETRMDNKNNECGVERGKKARNQEDCFNGCLDDLAGGKLQDKL